MWQNDNRAVGHFGLVSISSTPSAGIIKPAGPSLISFCAGSAMQSEDCGWGIISPSKGQRKLSTPKVAHDTFGPIRNNFTRAGKNEGSSPRSIYVIVAAQLSLKYNEMRWQLEHSHEKLFCVAVAAPSAISPTIQKLGEIASDHLLSKCQRRSFPYMHQYYVCLYLSAVTTLSLMKALNKPYGDY